MSFAIPVAPCINPPALNHGLHVGRNLGGKEHFLVRAGMDKAESAGMESLTWAYLKAVLHELTVFCRAFASEYFVATVAGVV